MFVENDRQRRRQAFLHAFRPATAENRHERTNDDQHERTADQRNQDEGKIFTETKRTFVDEKTNAVGFTVGRVDSEQSTFFRTELIFADATQMPSSEEFFLLEKQFGDATVLVANGGNRRVDRLIVEFPMDFLNRTKIVVLQIGRSSHENRHRRINLTFEGTTIVLRFADENQRSTFDVNDEFAVDRLESVGLDAVRINALLLAFGDVVQLKH